MSYTTWKIKHTPFLNNGWDDGDETTVTPIHNPILRLSLGEKKDSFSFRVTNFNGEYNNFFNVKDRYEISRVTNSTSFTDNDILMIGAAKDIPLERSGTVNYIKPSGYNFSETVASALVFVDLAGNDIPTALENALNSAARKNPNFEVTWHPDNPTTKVDGSAFPTVDSADDKYYNKPLLKILEKYSTKQKTLDTHYYWYIDTQNRLVWLPQKDDVDDTFDASTGTYLSIKEGKDLKGVRNYIVIKGGIDPQGNQIQTYYANWSSINSNGMKYHFLISENNNAKDLVQGDLRAAYGDDIGANSYPSDFTTTYTTLWKSAATGAVVACNSEDDYVAAVRAHVKAAIYEEAVGFADAVKWGKLTVDIAFVAGSQSWGLGDNIQVTIPTLRELPFVLRVSEIQYTEKVDTYTLTEDEGTIGK